MRPVVSTSPSLPLAIALAVACGGQLPPTEPPPGGVDNLGTTTNDAPIAAPLAHDGALVPGAAEGGTNALPIPGPSSGNGGTGAGGTAAR
jgi:hypothetical protein